MQARLAWRGNVTPRYSFGMIAVACCRRRAVAGAVAAAPAQEPVPVVDRERRLGTRLWVERVARVHPADVRAGRAGEPQRVGAVVAEVVVVAKPGVVPVRRLDQGSAARPPAHHLRGQHGARAGIVGAVRPAGRLPGVAPEAVDVLFKLAHDQIAPVAAQVGRAAPGRIPR
jgi:hypothetical protein